MHKIILPLFGIKSTKAMNITRFCTVFWTIQVLRYQRIADKKARNVIILLSSATGTGSFVHFHESRFGIKTSRFRESDI